MLELPVNKYHSGSGYNVQDLKKPKLIVVEGKVIPLSHFFSSFRHLVNDHICTLEEDGKVKEEGLIYKKTEGRGAINWTVFELPEVTML